MRKILFTIGLLISLAATSQMKQPYYQYGGLWKRLEATTGLRLPLVTTGSTDMNAGPAVGDVYYEIADGYTYTWNGVAWVKLAKYTDVTGLAPRWELTGNTGTTAGTNFIGTGDNVSFVLKTNATERIRILNTGETGIGTTTPASKLTVSTASIGVTQSDAYGLFLSNPTAATSGNQQISPGFVLGGFGFKTTGSVSRDVRWRVDVLPIQGGFGQEPTSQLRFSSSIAGASYINYMSLLSGGALLLANASGNFGSFNTIPIGGKAAGLFVGSDPLSVTGTAAGNTGLGSLALNGLTDGISNTAVGVQALYANTTGGLNTAAGVLALGGNTSGYSNVAIGMNAMRISTTAFQNTFVGTGAGENFTTGQENSALGYNAGLNATTAIRNVWMGWNAKSSTDGLGNVVIGYAGGTSLTAGNSYNVFIGYNSGNNGSQVGNVTNSIAIGEGTYTDASNSVVIGNSSITKFDFYGALRPAGSAGTSGQVLKSQGAGTSPVWSSTVTLRWVPRVGSTASSATPTINTDNVDIYKLTALAANITSFTTNLSGTPNDGDILELQITDDGTPRTIAFGASFVASSIALPTTTAASTTLTVIFQYYTTSSYGNNKWICVNSY